MDTETGKDTARLIDELVQRAPEYSVFQAIYLAEKLSKKIHPDRDDEAFDQKGLRFRPHEYYAYPPKDIRRFEYDNGLMTFIMNFMGLYGINSPLPRCYHEEVAAQQSVHGEGSVPLQNFLDIFNTRSYWLYYQAWKKYRYHLQLGTDFDNKIVQRVFAFTGQIAPADRLREPVARFKLFRLSSVLSQKVRNSMGLQVILQEFFPTVAFHVKEFVPHRVELAVLPQIGGSGEGGKPFQLGKFSILGRSVIDYMSRICVEIGPITLEEYLEFTPESEKAALLRDLINLYVHDGLEYDIKFILRADTFGTIPWNDRRLRLGLSLWMGKPKEETVDVYYTYERFVQKFH
jgi:type VI secretion system protein ImpH